MTPRFTVLAACLVLGLARSASAQVDDSSFFRGIATGIGARAWSMGGAQIAVPGSVEATTWNPAAGAVLTRPAVSFALSGDRLNGVLRHASYANPSAQQSGLVDEGTITGIRALATGAGIDHAALVWPVDVGGHRVTVTGAYTRRLAFARHVDSSYQFRHQSLYTYNYDYTYRASQTGAFDTIGVSFATEVRRGFFVGGTVHRWLGTAAIPSAETYSYSVANYYAWTGTWTEDYADRVTFGVSGFSADVGGLVAIRHAFIGLVYRTSSAASLAYSNAPFAQNNYTQDTHSSTYAGTSTLHLPSSIGVGVSVHLRPNLLVACDVLGTRWARARVDAYARATAEGPAPTPSAYVFPTMKPASVLAQSSSARTAAGLDYTLSVGSHRVPIRAGGFYEQTYLDDGNPGTWGATLGTGMRWREASIDATWVHEASVGRFARNSLRTSLGWAF